MKGNDCEIILSAMMPLRLITILMLLANVVGAADSLQFAQGQPAPEMDALFQQTNGWIGGDGVYSVALLNNKTLWLFSDTWIGSVRDGKRVGAHMVNNTLALQDGHLPNAQVQFIVRKNAEGKPVAFVTPEDKRGWFWIWSTAYVDQRLFLFLPQFDSTGAGGAFGFRLIGQSLGIVTNPLAPPLEWVVEQHKLPCVEVSSEHHRTYGSASVVAGEYLYIYGTDEIPGKHGRSSTVARVPTNHVADFSAWRYFADGQWDADYRKATGIAGGMATEYSVSFLPKLGQYVLVYTERGMSPRIQVRTSPTPWGKWSDPVTVYQCPEMSEKKGVFCYAAKAHPSQAGDDALMISYVVNAYSVPQVMADASLYWPRFVRLPLK